MSFYGILLIVHSAIRWFLLAACLLTLGRSIQGWLKGKDFTRWDQRLVRFFVSTVDTQVLVGLTLYFAVSPIAAIARADFVAAWHDPNLRFFGIVHPLLMLSAFIAAHVTRVAAWRANAPPQRHRRLALGALLTASLLALAIPWPFMQYGRPHLRLALGGQSQ